jgi:FKBP-type peptidyl-prolyl cis-trans isomerase
MVGSTLVMVCALALAPQNPAGKRPQDRRPPPPVPADVEPVTTTATGLKYCVLKAGAAGESPRWGDKAKVHYSEWHADGTFLGTTRGGEPTEFPLGTSIDGVNEALQLMTPGAQWKLTVPPVLAHGTRGSPPLIKPDETLVLEVELVSFTKGPPLPPFHPGDPAKQKKTESGLVYETLVEGSGEPPKPDDVLDLKFAVWTTSGRMIDCTEMHDDHHFVGRIADFEVRVLQLAPQFMTPGARFRFEAPAAMCRGLPYGTPYLPEGAPAVWEFELVSARHVEMPPLPKIDPAQQKTTASGLKYEVLKDGSGDSAKVGDRIEVDYVGWMADGTVFDSTLLTGKPMVIPRLSTRDMIAGWVEGLTMMKVGSKYRFVIPPELAYGAQGFRKIPGNSTLTFEIEMRKLDH